MTRPAAFVLKGYPLTAFQHVCAAVVGVWLLGRVRLQPGLYFWLFFVDRSMKLRVRLCSRPCRQVLEQLHRSAQEQLGSRAAMVKSPGF